MRTYSRSKQLFSTWCTGRVARALGNVKLIIAHLERPVVSCIEIFVGVCYLLELLFLKIINFNFKKILSLQCYTTMFNKIHISVHITAYHQLYDCFARRLF